MKAPPARDGNLDDMSDTIASTRSLIKALEKDIAECEALQKTYTGLHKSNLKCAIDNEKQV